jgi:uncharacterized protein (TIGR03435 family)
MYGRAVILALCGAVAAFGQSGDPAFDVVSVKALGPNIGYGPGPGMTLGLRFTGTRVSGKTQIPALIGQAYSLDWFQIQLPDKEDLRLNVYEIGAVMPEGTSRETAKLMLRSMLVERFGLRFHRETKEIPVYALTAPAGKTKLEAVDPEKAKERTLDTPMGPRKGVQSVSGRGFYAAAYTPLESFAGQMSTHLDRPVIDQTGLKGSYSIELRWDPADEMDLIAVIERQLGLKLEKRKMPIEMFVVDRVELSPSAN